MSLSECTYVDRATYMKRIPCPDSRAALNADLMHTSQSHAVRMLPQAAVNSKATMQSSHSGSKLTAMSQEHHGRSETYEGRYEQAPSIVLWRGAVSSMPRNISIS